MHRLGVTMLMACACLLLGAPAFHLGNQTTSLGSDTGIRFPSAGDGAASPVFDTGDPATATWGPTDLATLSTSITHNGQTVEADALYLAQNADSSTWTATVGGGLSIAEDGASPTLDASAPFSDVTRAVDFSDGDYYEADDSAEADNDDDDMIVEVVFKHVLDGASYGVASKKLTNTEGWDIWYDNSVNRLYFEFEDSFNNRSVALFAAPAEGWVHFLVFFDEDGTKYIYINGLQADSDTNDVGSISTTEPLQVGARRGGSLNMRGPIAEVGIWVADGAWLSGTSSEYAAIAAERFARISGTYLDTGGTPSTATRASSAWLRVCDPDTDTITYHLVGENWPRREVDCGYSNFSDPTASETTVASFIQEASVTNIVGFGTALDNPAWTKINSATVDANQQDDPAGNPTLDDIDGVTGSGEHGVSQAQTLTAASYVLSAVFKPGNQTFAYADVSSIANVSAYWDSSDCQPDTVGSAATAYGYDLGDLCYIHLVYTGTAASHTHRLLCAEADNDKDYAGAAGDCAYGWVGVAQAGAPHSPILTTSNANVTRSADALVYSPGLSAGPQTIVADFSTLVADYSLTVYENSSNRHALLNSGVNGNAIGLNGGTLHFNLNTGVAVFDGDRHIMRSRWAADDVSVYVDGSEEGTDSSTSGDTAPAASYVAIGQDQAGGNILSGSIYRARVYDQAIAPGEQGTGDDTP
jgi:hypothetical protein